MQNGIIRERVFRIYVLYQMVAIVLNLLAKDSTLDRMRRPCWYRGFFIKERKL